MYTWISAVGLSSDVISDHFLIDCQLFSSFNQSKLFPMSATTTSAMTQRPLYNQQWISSLSNHHLYETNIGIDEFDSNDAQSMTHHQWIPNITHLRMDQSQCTTGDTPASVILGDQWVSSMNDDDKEVHTYDTQHQMIQSQTNLCEPINGLCLSVFDSEEDLDDERLISLMKGIDFGTDHDQELRDRILKQKRTSNCGFSALQRRIEKVKHDLFTLTNKLNTNYSAEEGNCYYNLGMGAVLDEEVEGLEKPWKCVNHTVNKNPFSELSESTQKILGRLNLKEDEREGEMEVVDMDEDELEMEEDELEFTFSNRQNSMLNSFTVRGGALPIINEEEEEKEEDSLTASDSDEEEDEEETESAKSTVIERRMVSTTTDTSSTPQSISMHSFDITESDPFVTPLSSFRVCDQKRSDYPDDTEEYLSDFAKCSVSSSSSRESLKSQEVDKMDASYTETTIKAEKGHAEEVSDNDISLKDKCSSSSLKGEEDFLGSEAEYDTSGWSTEDIPQSVEQSDSLYEKPLRPMLKASLPDLLESSSGDGHDIGGTLGVSRQYNKSTDLDAALDEATSPYLGPPSQDGRLSQSLCNLFSSVKSSSSSMKTFIRPDDFFQERASFDNLLETDLDSGYVSMYKPVKETEILPRVDFSCSMVNVSQATDPGSPKRPPRATPLVSRLRRNAGSVQELRIADSLSKLNLPDWMNLREDHRARPMVFEKEEGYRGASLPLRRSPTSLDRALLSSQKRHQSLSRDADLHLLHNHVSPVIHSKSTVVLPSQLLRQTSSGRKLTPIKVCQARLSMLLPNKVTVH